ncbi:MAG TPA: hypothetical protein VF458_09640 [Ktedonobacteraceae bacterium]
MDRPPSEMSLVELQNRCWWEMEKFSHRQQCAEEYCLEIFRRALVLRNEQAWEILIQRFSATIIGWLRRHPYREEAARLHIQEKDYADLTIARLWVAAHNQPLEFHSLAGALWFLRKTLNAAVIDTIREMKSKELPLQETAFVEPAAPEEEDLERWETIKSMLPDEREKRLAQLLFYCNLTPREVVHYCPQEFSDIQEVYKLKRGILDRLRRNKDRLRYLLGNSDF